MSLVDEAALQATPIPYHKLPEEWEPLLKYTAQHPDYHEVFTNTIYTLFYGSGNLPFHTRHYIAIMGATRHRCKFLIDIHKREFEKTGGNMEWLKGISYTNQKMKELDNCNLVFAHQPWLFNVDYINRISFLPNDGHWNLNDLTWALVILSQTHCLCSFIHSVGFTHTFAPKPEPQITEVQNKENNGKNAGEIEELLRKMYRLAAKEVKPTKEAQNQHNFLALAEGSLDSGCGGDSPPGDVKAEAIFSEQPNFAYIDFAARTDGSKTFKSHEFTWQNHGVNLIYDIHRDLAIRLDKKFETMQNLTYSFMGGYTNVDTTAYRLAIWNYIQALFGIRHDDYDYAEVNALLSREMKTFVKMVACFPNRLTAELRQAVMREFKDSEKLHVVLMIMEARLQASMLYFTRAMTNIRLSPHVKPLD